MAQQQCPTPAGDEIVWDNAAPSAKSFDWCKATPAALAKAGNSRALIDALENIDYGIKGRVGHGVTRAQLLEALLATVDAPYDTERLGRMASNGFINMKWWARPYLNRAWDHRLGLGYQI